MKLRSLFLVFTLIFLSCNQEKPEIAILDTPQFNIVISAAEGGTVSTSGGKYENGTKISVVATPSQEYNFSSWSDGSTENPREITVSSNINIQSIFIKKIYELVVSIQGNGTFEQNILVSGSVDRSYNSGTKLQLKAVNSVDGWIFNSWEGDVVSEDRTIVVDMNKAINLTLKFDEYPIYTMMVEEYGNPDLGLDIYLNRLDPNGRACVNCHIAPSGFDLVHFGKSNQRLQDSIVVSRALLDHSSGIGHISLEESFHVAAYLKKLGIEEGITPNDNDNVIPLPYGRSYDEVWNGSSVLTVEQVNQWDFRGEIEIPFEFPKWFEGDETNNLIDDNLDFIPEIDLVNEKDIVKEAFEGYLNNPNKHTLKALLKKSHEALSEGERNPGEHGFNNFNKAFDYQRWMATVYFQHILSPNSDLSFGDEIDDDISNFSLIDPVWDVGNIARRSEDNGTLTGNGNEIQNRLENEVKWLYLGWLGNFGKRNSFETQYIGSALRDFGHPKLGVLVTLKSLISRSSNSQRMYDDLFTLTFVNTPETLFRSLEFGTNYLINGLETEYSFFLLKSQHDFTHARNGILNTINFVESSDQLTTEEKSVLNSKLDILKDLMETMEF